MKFLSLEWFWIHCLFVAPILTIVTSSVALLCVCDEIILLVFKKYFWFLAMILHLFSSISFSSVLVKSKKKVHCYFV